MRQGTKVTFIQRTEMGGVFAHNIISLMMDEAHYELRGRVEPEEQWDARSLFISITANEEDVEFWKAYAAGACDALRRRIEDCPKCASVNWSFDQAVDDLFGDEGDEKEEEQL